MLNREPLALKMDQPGVLKLLLQAEAHTLTRTPIARGGTNRHDQSAFSSRGGRERLYSPLQILRGIFFFFSIV